MGRTPTRAAVNGPLPDGRHTGPFPADRQPLGDRQSGPPPDPKLYCTYDGAMGEPRTPAFGTEKELMAS
jgi:Mn-containing catalase